eukprot:CAMPEP_0168485568 /NCGR_PEP_ID=MMETSP0228-20121227/66676_1 /TAXON_ID=133427 /ORGANISM="Protoceratium reticulatum, Strain CCCM 535 (=CCMP 1889)" /LENGTH=189 /DNA_ID=CAMNT_0008502135 /DNA_START=168 /DNA_END=733 /DNA_ORIENTATION=+
MGSVNVACLPEEIVALKRKARPVCKEEHLEARVDGYHPFAVCCRTRIPENPAAVGQCHLPVLHQALEDAHHLQGGLVSLVNDECATVAHSLHQRRVLPDHLSLDQRCLDGQGADGGVAVQLDVLALPAEELEQVIDKLVLASSLVPDQQHMFFTNAYVADDFPQTEQVPWDVEELGLWHKPGISISRNR